MEWPAPERGTDPQELFSHEVWKLWAGEAGPAAVSWPYAVHQYSPLYHTTGGLDNRAASQWGDLPVVVVLIRHGSCREHTHEAQSSEDLIQRAACLTPRCWD